MKKRLIRWTLALGVSTGIAATAFVGTSALAQSKGAGTLLMPEKSRPVEVIPAVVQPKAEGCKSCSPSKVSKQAVAKGAAKGECKVSSDARCGSGERSPVSAGHGKHNADKAVAKTGQCPGQATVCCAK